VPLPGGTEGIVEESTIQLIDVAPSGSSRVVASIPKLDQPNFSWWGGVLFEDGSAAIHQNKIYRVSPDGALDPNGIDACQPMAVHAVDPMSAYFFESKTCNDVVFGVSMPAGSPRSTLHRRAQDLTTSGPSLMQAIRAFLCLGNSVLHTMTAVVGRFPFTLRLPPIRSPGMEADSLRWSGELPADTCLMDPWMKRSPGQRSRRLSEHLDRSLWYSVELPVLLGGPYSMATVAAASAPI